MCQEAAARGDEAEAQPAGDHRSNPNTTWEMALLLCDFLNTQLAQRGSHLSYIMGRLRSHMRGKSSPLRFEKNWVFLHPSPLPANGTCRESWERAGGMRNRDTYSGISSLNPKAFLSSFQTVWRWHITLWIWNSLGNLHVLLLPACYVNSYITCLMIQEFDHFNLEQIVS